LRVTAAFAAACAALAIGAGCAAIIGIDPLPPRPDAAADDGDATDATVASCVTPIEAGTTPIPLCASDLACWANPLPTGANYTAVWASSCNDVWVVGTGATVIHWDGRAWSLLDTKDTRLTDYTTVTGSSANDVWIGATNGYLEHWDGSRFQSVYVANAAGIVSLWASGAKSVWGIDSLGQSLFYGGTSWVVKGLAPPQGVAGIWAASSDDAWAVGHSGATYHWQKDSWTSVASGTTDDILAVWGSGPSDVWAITNSGALRFDGTEWHPFDIKLSANESPMAVWGSASDDVWILTLSALHHWDGSQLTVSAAPDHPTRAGWSTSARELFLVGADGQITHRLDGNLADMSTSLLGTFTSIYAYSSKDVWFTEQYGTPLHWDGLSFTAFQIPGAPDVGPFYASWAHAGSDTSSGVWMAGMDGAFVFDGQTWTRSSHPDMSGHTIHGMWGQDLTISHDVWAVGDGPAGPEIYHWDDMGARWLTEPISPPDGGAFDAGTLPGATFGAVTGTSATDIWAVGDHGLIAHQDGSGWRFVPSPVTANLQAVAALAPNNAWAAGTRSANGAEVPVVVIHWNGTAWVELPLTAGVCGRCSAPSVALYASPAGPFLAAGDVLSQIGVDTQIVSVIAVVPYPASPIALFGSTAAGASGTTLWMAGAAERIQKYTF
jgi:hypothetical protein